MKLTRLPSLLPGERPVAVHPPFAPAIDAAWQRRLNVYSGRTLTASALDAEQTHRAARLALVGQALSPGIVHGLESTIETETQIVEGTPRTIDYIRIAPGLGITAEGEDIGLDQAQRVEIMNIPVFATAAMLGEPDGGTLGESVMTGALSARRLGPELRQLISPERGLPHAGVLVLQATYTEIVGEFDPTDPCERDPQNEAYEDQLKADTLRLTYYAWPDEWLPMPVADAQWRNRLAYGVFEAEKKLQSDAVLPWEELGVPIALIGFSADWRPLFADRAAVARAGGKPKRRTGVHAQGTPFLWQARIEQLAEHTAEFVQSELTLPRPGGMDEQQWRADIAARLPAQFRYLPPAGLLPKEIAAPRSGVQSFFPASYTVDAVPVPVEQLDVAIDQSAGLAAFDTSTMDSVRVLVPVPNDWYEPDLLRNAEVTEEFAVRLADFVADRGVWLQRRADVRVKASALKRAISGKALEFPVPDSDALEEEAVGGDPLEPPEDGYGTATGADGTISVIEFEKLKDQLRGTTPITGVASVSLATAPAFPASLPAPLRARITHDAGSRLLAFSGVMTSAERDQLSAVSSDAVYRNALDRLYGRTQLDELSQLDALGVEGFMALLEAKIARSDDLVDFGFLRVQTDLFRIRQLVLGTTAASRLAISPALAGFAKTKSAAASQQQLAKFYQNLKGRSVAASTDAGIGAAAAPAPAAAAVNVATAARASAVASTRATSAAGDFQLNQIRSGTAAFDVLSAGSQPRILDVLAEQSAPTLIKGTVGATLDDVVGQSAVVGKALLRTSTIAERMEAPQAPEAKNSATATKHDVVKSLAELPISLEGLTVAGIATGEVDQKSGLPVRGPARLLSDFMDAGALRQLLDEPDPRSDDESLFFVSGVELSDHTIAVLRTVEGRIQQYRTALELCRAALTTLKATSRGAGLRLQLIDRELAEARHDVAVARALLAEETARVARINERRDQIVREHVKFLAYMRPRSMDSLLAAPLRPLAAGLYESPVPACVRNHGDGPHELRALIEVLREAPVSWFTALRPKLTRFDRPEVLREVAQFSKMRAAQFLPREADDFPARGAQLADAVKTVVTAQTGAIAVQRAATARLDLSAIAGASWEIARDELGALVSLGDLMDHPGRRVDVAQQVSAELQRITNVAACLHARFAEAPPVVRLTWVERLSQYDGPLNLRNLSALPRFGELDVLDRRDLQALVDWLYGRVDPAQAKAVDLVHDLVRLAILLASYAPVNEIISGRVRVPATVRPGHRIELTAFDMSKVRIGMQVMMYDAARVVARAVVEDLSATQVAARIVEADAGGVALDTEMKVQYTEARALGFGSMVMAGA